MCRHAYDRLITSAILGEKLIVSDEGSRLQNLLLEKISC